MTIRRNRPSFALSEKIGLGALLVAGILFLPAPGLSAVVLGLFVLLCLAAPFFTGIGFFMPIISRGGAEKGAVALTFDDGPDPATTPRLLELLAARNIPTAFFVTGLRAMKHPELVREILSRGHEVANHTFHHDPLIMLKSGRTLSREIHQTREILSQQFGINALAVRPPAGIVSPRMAEVLRGSDMFVVNFNRRAGDRGNRRTRGIARRILGRLKSGDIVLLHDVRPLGDQTVDDWLSEVALLLDGIEERGLGVLPLSDLISRPITKSVLPV